MTGDDRFEPAHRELCPDGTCIGLIGVDGRCKACGAVSPLSTADPRNQGMIPANRDDLDADADDDRQLCTDGACVGLIGEDGRCRECGRPGEVGPGSSAARNGRSAAVATADDTADSARDDGDDERVLCVDGGCIGLVGKDGKCRECGLPGPPPSP